MNLVDHLRESHATLAATRLTPDVRLWTRHRRLATAAARLDLLVEPSAPAGTGPDGG
ncbi:hypothetical protein [Geodermatophilus sp. DSM 44513]|uniref:hypothetical protein n=1 Tax=Geodermatophilus sp. DSM 44513 TaxID=1528104 RepID=UPI00127EB11D|nr:hypothetical protein [Geodermatophilus sp. DSM 44513]WNV76499.1 hypothetical protein RTG05_04315 [Geodermatophilus sp. DSM 44513]